MVTPLHFRARLAALPFAVLSLTVLLPQAAWACASCGCTLSSDWDTLGVSNSSGLKLDIRYDYLDQNQLRSGTRAISPAAASQKSHNGDPLEVEKYTRNDYLTLGLDYSFNASWGVNLQVPYIIRSHDTLGTASDGFTAGPDGGQYSSRISGIGDVKLIGRFQGFTPQHNFGVLFGVKLPTGSHTKTGTSSDPEAPGPVPIDRGLQPGSGTTDAILGLYYLDTLSKNWDYFAQGIVQRALNSSDRYRPGDGVNLNVGLRYMGNEYFMPQIQLNARHVMRDEGANADTVSTGGTLVYLSPGVTVPVTQKMSLYSFVQVPVYQNVNGVQLTPRYTATVGARYAF